MQQYINTYKCASLDEEVLLQDSGLHNTTSITGEKGYKRVRKVHFALLPVLFFLLNFALCTAQLHSDRIRPDDIIHKKLTKMACKLVFAALACASHDNCKKEASQCVIMSRHNDLFCAETQTGFRKRVTIFW